MTTQNVFWAWTTAAAICQVLVVLFGFFAASAKDKLNLESTQETRAQIAQGTQETRNDIAAARTELLEAIHSSQPNLSPEIAAEKTKQVEAVEVANTEVLRRDFPFGYALLRVEDDKGWFSWQRLKPGQGEFNWKQTEVMELTPATVTIALPDYLDSKRHNFSSSNSVVIRRAVGQSIPIIGFDDMVLAARVLASDANSVTVAVGARPIP